MGQHNVQNAQRLAGTATRSSLLSSTTTVVPPDTMLHRQDTRQGRWSECATQKRTSWLYWNRSPWRLER